MIKDKPDLRRMTIHERKCLAEKIYIYSPQHIRVLERIKQCVEHSKIAAEPHCLLIVGESGTGKSTLIERFSRNYSRTTVEGRTQVPVLATRIPSKPTVKGFVTHLLHALGDPCYKNGTEVEQTIRFRDLFEECAVELMILDEFQAFIEKDSDKVLYAVSQWLKINIDETKKPVVLCGTPECTDVLRANRELRRRFSARETLAPLAWGGSDKGDDFCTFLKLLEDALPLKEASNLTDADTAFRCYRASEDGIIGYLMKIIRAATVLALDGKRERITIEDLARAYDDEVATHEPGAVNPFKVGLDSLKGPLPREESGPKATNHRVKRKGSRMRASRILKGEV